MLKDFQEYIAKYNLVSDKGATLIGVSGGRDSVVLCDLYRRAGLPFALAHCNFNLRGQESDADEAFVIELARQFGVELYRKNCDTKAYAQSQGISIQMAARDIRFNWFKELVEEHKFPYYATAHHQDDVIETYFINQIRGTGIAGLHGILPKLNQLVHPLLFASREDIDAYIEKNQIKYREDSSNSSIKYLRNKLRHQLIPLLEDINPDIKKILLNNMKRIYSAEQILQLKVEECRKEFCHWVDDHLFIHIASVTTHEFAPTLLYELIKEFGFNYSQAEQALHINEETISGAKFYSDRSILLRDREHLIIKKADGKPTKRLDITRDTQSISHPLQIEFSQSTDFKIIRHNQTAQFDMEKLHFPLSLRKWHTGDYFYPLGMKGKKKLLSDFFIDQKLSVFEKEAVWLLCSHDQIVWVIGHRMDDRFKISSGTKLIYQAVIK
jgi:tRNA(Ile)-lysidine synthase